MAERKSPHVEPVLDSKSDADNLSSNHSLPKQSYQNIIRLLHRSGANVVLSVRSATHENLKRLAVRRDRSKAVQNCPKGSDQVDVQSIVQWANKVDKTDKKSVRQLVAIDATAVARSS